MGADAPLPPAGWYPDPTGGPVQRYFDGQRWTEHRAASPSAPKVMPWWIKFVAAVVVVIVLAVALDRLLSSL